MTKPRYAIFDIDLTLTQRPTWSHFLSYANEGRPTTKLKTVAATAAKALQYKLGGAQRTDVKVAALQAGLAGREAAELKPLAEVFAKEVVERGLRKRAVEVIEAHKTAGHRVAVASAAVDLIVDPVCDLLGIDTRLCTPMVWEGGTLAGRFGGANCYDDEKARRVRDLIAREEADLLAFYSDHVTDLAIMREAEYGIAINPSPKLRAAAAKYGLIVQNWETDGPVGIPV